MTDPLARDKAFRTLLVLCALAALAVRVYYLWLTRDQPVWWDEANYLVKAKSLALGTPATGYDAGRPIVFSWMMVPYFWLGAGEPGVRITLALASLASVFLVHRLGTRLLGVWAGLIGAALFACHNQNLFFSYRVMCEIPYVTMALLGLELFLSGRKYLVWVAGPVLGLAVLLRYPAFVILLSLFIYLLVTEKKQAPGRKDYYVAAALGVAAMALDLAFRGGKTLGAVSWLFKFEGFSGLSRCVKVFFSMFHPLLMLALVIGILIALWYLITWRSREPKAARAHLLLLLLLVGPILLHGMFISHLEERYLFLALPPAFLLIASAALHVVRIFTGKLRRLASGVTGLGVLLLCLVLLRDSDWLIRQRLHTFAELRAAGLWIRQQKVEGAVLSQSVAQLTYYSEKPGRRFPGTREEFTELLRESEFQYFVLSTFEQHPDYLKTMNIQEHGLQIVRAETKEKPVVLVIVRAAGSS